MIPLLKECGEREGDDTAIRMAKVITLCYFPCFKDCSYTYITMWQGPLLHMLNKNRKYGFSALLQISTSTIYMIIGTCLIPLRSSIWAAQYCPLRSPKY